MVAQQLTMMTAVILFAVIMRGKWAQKAPKLIINTVWALLIFQSLLALYQFWAQAPLFPYPVLGETDLRVSSDIAAVVWSGRRLAAPYGTFSHPNILAGTLAVLLWWLWRQTQRQVPRQAAKNGCLGSVWRFFAWWQKIAIFLALSVIVLTQSWSALIFLSLILLSLLWSQKGTKVHHKWWLSALVLFLLPFCLMLGQTRWPNNLSFSRRTQLNAAAWKMWQAQPLFGVGPGQFTAYLSDFWPSNHFTQPVHHLFLLFLAETGLVGLAVLIVAIFGLRQKSPPFAYFLDQISFFEILAWGVLFSLDHYFLTSFWGFLLGCVFL